MITKLPHEEVSQLLVMGHTMVYLLHLYIWNFASHLMFTMMFNSHLPSRNDFDTFTLTQRCRDFHHIYNSQVLGHRIERADVEILYNFIGDTNLYLSASTPSGYILF